MEALKTFNIAELLERQRMLDREFDRKETLRNRTETGVLVAALTEWGELSQELKSEWNYWKNTQAPYNRQRVLEELSDYFHFVLSYISLCIDNPGNSVTAAGVQRELDDYPFLAAPVRAADNALHRLTGIGGYEETDERMAWYLTNILEFLISLDYTVEEFLEAHHRKFLTNMNTRTKEEY